MLCHLSGESKDIKGRFGILLNSDGSIAISCFNCGFSSKFIPGTTLSKKFTIFLKEIGISQYDIKKINFELYRHQNNMQTDSQVSIRGSVTSKWKNLELPTHALSLETWKNANCTDVNFQKVLEYATSRKFTELDDLYWSPGQESDSIHPFQKRLILPFYYKNQLVGYTGRYFGQSLSSSIPKYVNIMPQDYIYNLDDQSDNDRKYVIVNEGVLDAYVTNGISTCGNSINEDQVQLINSLGKIVVVCPDRDDAGDNLVTTALVEKWQVSFPNWELGIKDAASAATVYGRILTVQSIIAASERNPTSIELKWKLNKNNRKNMEKVINGRRDTL